MLVYRGGNGIAQATAELCFGDFNPSGKLPFQLPRSIDQVGTDNVNDQKERWELPYDLGATDAERSQIRSYIANNQPVPSTFGNPLFPYGYGLQNFNISIPSGREATDDLLASEESSDLLLYPNPTDGVIHLPGVKDGTPVKVISLSGQPSLQTKVSHGSIDISQLVKGLYVIDVSDGKVFVRKKVMLR